MNDQRGSAARTGGTHDRPLTRDHVLWSAAAAAALVAAAMAVFARGLAGDEEVAHYLIARYAPAQPSLFLSEVGRPVVTFLLCLPSQLGLTAARLLSALAAGLTAYAVARVALRTGWINPLVAALFLLVQPFYLAHAGTAMTEPWAALLVAAGLLAFAEKRMPLLAVTGCLLPLARMEMVLLWPLLALVFWRERRRGWILVLPLGMLLWNLLGALTYGDPLYLLHLDPRVYPAREALLYARSFVWILGWGLFVPVVWGLVRAAAMVLGKEPGTGDPVHRALQLRVLGAAALVVLGAFALYTYLATWRPITFGNLRYLAIMAPLFALLAGAGVDMVRRLRGPAVWIGLALAAGGAVWLWGHTVHEGSDLLGRRSWIPLLIVLLWAAVTVSPRLTRATAPALVIVLGVASLGVHHRGTLHLRPNGEQAGVEAASRLLDPAAVTAQPLYSLHPLLALYRGVNPYDRTVSPAVTLDLGDRAEAGALWFWDTHYTSRSGGVFGIEDLGADPRWRYEGGVIAADSAWAGAFFRRVGDRPVAAAVAVRGGLPWNEWFKAAQFVESGAGYAARAAEADPNDAHRWYMLADRLATTGDAPGARKALARAEAIAPDDPDRLSIRASILLLEGRIDEALQVVQQARQARPEDAYLRFLQGRLFWQMGRIEEARPLVKEAADMLPGRWDVQLLAGSVCLEADDLEGAQRYNRAVLALKPDFVPAHYRLAQCALRMGDPDLAEVHLRKLVELRPDVARGYLLLGELLDREGRREEAIAVMTRGMSASGGDSTLAARLNALKR